MHSPRELTGLGATLRLRFSQLLRNSLGAAIVSVAFHPALALGAGIRDGVPTYIVPEESFRPALETVPPLLNVSMLEPDPQRVVVGVRISPQNQVITPRILEAPSSSIAQAFLKAASSWKILRLPARAPSYIESTITFYVVRDGDVARVLTPSERAEWPPGVSSKRRVTAE